MIEDLRSQHGPITVGDRGSHDIGQSLSHKDLSKSCFHNACCTRAITGNHGALCSSASTDAYASVPGRRALNVIEQERLCHPFCHTHRHHTSGVVRYHVKSLVRFSCTTGGCVCGPLSPRARPQTFCHSQTTSSLPLWHLACAPPIFSRFSRPSCILRLQSTR